MLGETFYIISKKVLRRYYQPSLADFNKANFCVSFVSNDAIMKILPDLNDKDIKDILIEFEDLMQRLNVRLPNPALGINKESSRLIYLLVRIIRPIQIVETGVANGISTYFILNALIKNNFGSLISIDIDNNVASFLNDEERKRWRLKVLDVKRNPRKQFLKIIEELQELSIYIHDGDHSYPWQYMEYNTALNKLKPGGILLSDDVDSSYAFIDTFNNLNMFSIPAYGGILINRDKIFGYIVLSKK